MFKDVVFIESGRLRKSLILNLDKPKTPARLAKFLKVHRASVSRTLLKLEAKGFVICLNPEDKKVRFYNLTKKGEEILKKIKELGLVE